MAPCSLHIAVLIHTEIPHVYSDKHSISKAVERNKAAQFVLSLSFHDGVWLRSLQSVELNFICCMARAAQRSFSCPRVDHPTFVCTRREIGRLGFQSSARRRVTFHGSLIMQRENRVCWVPENRLPRPTFQAFYVCARSPIPLLCA